MSRCRQGQYWRRHAADDLSMMASRFRYGVNAKGINLKETCSKGTKVESIWVSFEKIISSGPFWSTSTLFTLTTISLTSPSCAEDQERSRHFHHQHYLRRFPQYLRYYSSMNNMADFLNQLPTVEQPPHSECVICLLPYGAAQDEGTIEHPVRLPVSDPPSIALNTWSNKHSVCKYRS